MGTISDEIVKKLKKDFYIIDVHAHIGETVGVGVYLPEYIRVRAEDLLRSMKLNGTDKAVISPLVGYPRPHGIKDTMRQNDEIAKAVEKYPDKFPCGLGIVDPYEGDKSIEEVHRIMRDLGLRGLLFYMTFQGTYLNNPLMVRILRELSKYPGAVVMAHTSSGIPGEPWRLGELAEMFPSLKFISAHPCVGIGQLGQHIPFCRRLKNLYVDTALWIPEDETWLTAKALGADHILYGGDIGGISRVSFGLLQLLLTDVFTEEELEMILSKNAAKIFNIKV
ncbi:MAG: amidohydrolase family protein [Candidatus Nezhaarchaeota archaeon]|nr:amidohydrolase family protein [Candidatus Nezhaarchaeota archaeon]